MRTYCYWIAGEQYAELAKLSISSVRKADPDASVLVVARAEPWVDHWTESAIIAVEPGPLMQENLRAQIRAMHHCKHADEFIFLDVDTVLLKPFPRLSTDIVVTWRDTIRDKAGNTADASAMPYNYGVFAVRRTEGGFAALYYLWNRIGQMHERFQEWYGNQIALLQLVGPRGRAENRRVSVMGQSVTVGFLPCDEWNYTPYSTDEDVSTKGILHFKGNQKEAMRDFA